MKKFISLLIIIFIFLIISSKISYSHLCDNVFKQADKLIVKPETYNIVVKDMATFKIFLQNNMDRGIAEISLIPESDAFNFTITPSIMSIPKGQRVYFQVTMMPKSNVKTGNYTINFRLVGGGREFKSFSLSSQNSQSNTNTPAPASSSILTVKSTKTPPVIDGLFNNDTTWKTSAVATNFSAANGGKAGFQTIALITFDRQNIYFGIYCYDEANNDSKRNDNVKITLASSSNSASSRTISITSKSQLSIKKGSTNIDTSNCSYKVLNDKKCWAAELSIPFSAIGINAPTSKVKWNLRIDRSKTGNSTEKSYWSADSSGYNNKNGLGEIFMAP